MIWAEAAGSAVWAAPVDGAVWADGAVWVDAVEEPAEKAALAGMARAGHAGGAFLGTTTTAE